MGKGEFRFHPYPCNKAEDDWPYEKVVDALRDGWRIISFPDMALSLDENRTYGLGFEFILEKWR